MMQQLNWEFFKVNILGVDVNFKVMMEEIIENVIMFKQFEVIVFKVKLLGNKDVVRKEKLREIIWVGIDIFKFLGL